MNHERRAPLWFPHKAQVFPSLIVLPRRNLVGRYFTLLEHLLRGEFTRACFYPRFAKLPAPTPRRRPRSAQDKQSNPLSSHSPFHSPIPSPRTHVIIVRRPGITELSQYIHRCAPTRVCRGDRTHGGGGRFISMLSPFRQPSYGNRLQQCG
jgi:hypothetical protein